MSEKKRPDFLYRWHKEPTENTKVPTVPVGFSQRMQGKIMEQWGVALTLDGANEKDLAVLSTFVSDALEQEAIVVSLAAWKSEHPHHPKVLKAKLRAGDMNAPMLQAVGHGSLDDLLPFYTEGDLLTLDIQGPTDALLYVTVLLRRGNEPVRLAYPYGPGDRYEPMRRLEMEWEVEPGPHHRTFLVLLSHYPLLELSTLIPHNQDMWSIDSAHIAIEAISWANVVQVDEVSFQLQQKK